MVSLPNLSICRRYKVRGEYKKTRISNYAKKTFLFPPKNYQPTIGYSSQITKKGHDNAIISIPIKKD